MAMIYRNPTASIACEKPVAMAIGNFDGVHIGHQALLSRVCQVAAEHGTQSAVVTYDKHPSALLSPALPTPLIATALHKERLLAQCGIDIIVQLSFTRDFADKSPALFLEELQQLLPFCYLNMGYDGRIGKDRSGEQKTLEALAAQLQFSLEYVTAERLGPHAVS